MNLDQARRVFSNFGWGAAGEVAVRIVGLAIAVYLARVLGPSLYGAVGVMLGLVSIFEIAVRGGTGFLGIREVALAPAAIPAMHARIMGLRLALAALCILFFWLATPMIAHWLAVPPALVMLYSLMLLAPALSVAWALRGLERMDVIAWGSILQRLLVLAGVLLLVTDRNTDLLRLPLVEVLSGLLIVLWFRARVSRQYGALSIRFSPRDWRDMSSETLPVTVSNLLAMVYIHGDILLLGWISGTEDAGHFLAAQKIPLTFMVLGALLSRASFPATSRLMADAPARALALHAALYRYLMLFVVPAIVASAFFATKLLEILFGGTFNTAAGALVLLLLTLPVVALTESLKHLLLAHGMAKRLMLGTGITAAVHVLMAIALIPGWHVTGAAVACIAGESTGLGLLLFLTLRACGGVPLRWLTAAPFVAGVAMALALVAGHDWGPVPRLAAAIAAYVGAAVLLRAVSVAEWRVAGHFVVDALERGTSPASK